MSGGDLLHVQYSPRDRSLDHIYRLPRDTASLEEWHRRRQLDLAAMDDAALAAEALRVVHRFSYEPDRYRRAWLAERRDAMQAERRRREAVR